MLQLSRSAKSITVRGAVAAAMAMAAYSAATLPAQAERKIPAVCANKPTEEARLRCGIEFYEGKIAAAKARSAEAKARSADAKARSADAKAQQAAALTQSADAKARSADAKARGAAADVRGAAAKKQTQAADASTQCMQRVAREAGDPKTLSAEQKATVRARILACG